MEPISERYKSYWATQIFALPKLIHMLSVPNSQVLEVLSIIKLTSGENQRGHFAFEKEISYFGVS
jgi:hypothetical protein